MPRSLAPSFLALLLLPFLHPSVSTAAEPLLDHIRLGEGALTYAAGGIMEAFPQDGIVNVITGDNQTVGNRMLLGRFDTLYLKLTNPADVAPGDLFTIYRKVRKVFHPVTRRYMGQLIIRSAVVQAVQVDPDLVTVKVVRAYASVSPGDPVVRFADSVRESVASEVRATDDLEGMVVDLQSDKAMTLVAQWNVVYLDRGRDDGVRPGDVMEVVRVGGNLPRRTVGEIKVLSADQRTATGLVVKSTSRVLTGDRLKLKAGSTAAPLSIMASVTAPADEAVSRQPESGKPNLDVQEDSRETKFTLSDLANQLHFESGEVTIKPEGYRTLDRIVEYLRTSADETLVRVEGHADSVEIGPSLRNRYPSNWELSKARASEVVRYLIEKGGIDSAKLSSVGLGDTKPVSSNLSEEGRQRNRRVEILLHGPAAGDAQAPIGEASASPEGGFSFSRLDGPETGAVPAPDPSPAEPAAIDLPAAEHSPAAEITETAPPDGEPPTPSDVPKD